MSMQKEIGANITHDNIKDFLWKTLKSGQVVPGFVLLISFSPIYDDTHIRLIATVTVSSVTPILVSSPFKNSAPPAQTFLLTL